MAINLGKVNISLNEFQRLSSGEYNVGEVKLAGQTKLTKMNNHINTKWFVNNEKLSHAEVIAIKEAFIKELSQNGVGDWRDNNRLQRTDGIPVQVQLGGVHRP